MQPALRSVFLTELALVEADHALKVAHKAENSSRTLTDFVGFSNNLLQALATLPGSGTMALDSASEMLQQALPALERESGTDSRSAYRLCANMAESLASLREHASNAESFL